MTWSHRIRQWHRWLSAAFTLAVLANFVTMALAIDAMWVGLLALVPLIPLLLTGVYLFVLPWLRPNGRPAADPPGA